MAGVAAIAAIASVAIAAGGTAYTISESEKAKKEAKKDKKKQEEQQRKLGDELKGQQATEDANLARDAAQKRQRALASGAQGRSSTILTSPLGVVGQASGAGKTLLGS